jgi:glycosyltransferase involved in cell wall biosynthesis
VPEVGLNGLLLDWPHSGTAAYTRGLVPLLPIVAPDLDFRLFIRDGDFLAAGVATERLHTPLGAINRGSGVGARVDKFVWEEAALPAAAAARHQSLIHSLYFAAPVLATCPVVVTIHDVIPLVVPGYHRSRQSLVYSAFMARAVKRAAAVLTVSEHSRRDIVRTLGIAESRVFVTYEAVDDRFSPEAEDGEREEVRRRYALPERFVLYTGGAERRKGIDTLVRAWSVVASRMRSRGVGLVVVADFPPPDRLYPDIRGLARELGVEAEITFVRVVAEEDIPALYRSALAFAFPSTYEGFGFTPLEALASGLPVIASNATSIPEVVGDAGVLLPPGDIPAWADALVHVVEGDAERESLLARRVERARSFSWLKTAEQTAAVYREVLS